MNEMRRQAQIMQQRLAEERVVVDRDGVHIVMTGDQKVLEFSVLPGTSNDAIKDVLNEAIMKTQQIAAMQLQSMG